MLLVKTYLSTSSIQGIGLFAECSIPKNTVIWKYDKMTTIDYSKEDWETMKNTLPSLAFNNIFRFSYFHNNRWILNLDDSRFMNHSDTPNMNYDITAETCVAIRDIKQGEELTVDYNLFCDDGDIGL